MDRIIMFIATGAYSGYLPKAPGTWGTLVAFPIHFLLIHLSSQNYMIALGIIFIISIITAGGAEKIIDRKDPGVIVIDEIIGMLIALIGAPTSVISWVLAFTLFRIFDITKPFPISWLDRRLNGGTGIVLDDILAGFFALVCMQVFYYFF